MNCLVLFLRAMGISWLEIEIGATKLGIVTLGVVLKDEF